MPLQVLPHHHRYSRSLYNIQLTYIKSSIVFKPYLHTYVVVCQLSTVHSIPLVCILHCRSPLIVSARRSSPLRNLPSSLSSPTHTTFLSLSVQCLIYLILCCSLFSTRFCNLLLILFFYFSVVVAGLFFLVSPPTCPYPPCSNHRSRPYSRGT